MNKNKTWIIITIMGIALAISIIYSLILNNKINSIEPEKIVESTSIVQTTVAKVSIENTLSGIGTIKKYENNNASEIIDENGNIIENIANNKEAKVSLTIEQKEKEQLKENLEVVINEKESNIKYKGIIKQIEENTENNMCNILINFNEDMPLANDTIVECKVIIESAQDVVAVPVEAIQINNENKTYVVVINDDSTTTYVNVETGIADSSYIQITKGLEGGEKIQLTTSTTITSNMNNGATRQN